MSYYKSILICGGDQRQKYMYRYFVEKGLEAGTFALDCDNNIAMEDFKKFDVVVLPVPVSRDGVYLNVPLADFKVKTEDVLAALDKGQIVLGGMCGGTDIIDYYENESFQMQNAVPTAEGALQIAMENTDITVNKAYCAILGYGRIAKILASMLKNMGACVAVYARNPKDVALAKAFGFESFNITEIERNADKYDIFFNTVPKVIVDSDVLNKVKNSAVLIELASKPYGIDTEAAKKFGKKVIIASGLPGKVAPKTAGRILGDVIMDILMGMEV